MAAGFLARQAGGLMRARTITAGTGISITNTTGAGDPVITALGGVPVAVTFSAGNFTANNAGTWTVTSPEVTANQYAQLGSIVLWNIAIAASGITGAGITALLITLPGGLTTTSAAGSWLSGAGYVVDNAGRQLDYVVQVQDSTHIAIHRGGTAIPAGAASFHVYFSYWFGL
jgi:hypothetical protein